MALVHRIAHLSRLAFFVSLGVVATIVDACGGDSDDEHGAPDATKGGGTSTGQAGAGATETARGGGSSSTTQPKGTGGSAATGGTSGIEIDPGTEPKDAGLWDVICE